MKRTIGLVAAALAATALACGADERNIDTNGEEILPPEKSWGEMGLDEPGVEDTSNLVNTPRIPDGVKHEWSYASDNGGMSAIATEFAVSGTKIELKDRVQRHELLTCTDDGKCEYTTVHLKMNGEVISDSEAEEMGLPVDDRPVVGAPLGHVHSEPRNYWATDEVSAVGMTGGAGPSAPFAACDNVADICQIGFEPWCNGGAGKLSPGGIAESFTGCRGTSIKRGGPGNYRPDNANVRISYWGGAAWTCEDITWPYSLELPYVVDRLNWNDQVLPPPFELVRTSCGADGLPRGYGLCADQVHICPWDNYVEHGTLVDIMFQYDVLSDVEQTHHCHEARNAQAGRNRANARTVGCSSGILEREDYTNPSSPVKVRSWNNGWATTSYWTMRGAIVTIDPAAVTFHATRPSNILDRGGLNQATREWYTRIHVTAHEIGHSIGLTHSYIGPDGAPRWEPHSKLPNAMTPNSNIVPFSVMHRSVPAAPYTQRFWSSGLASNLVGMDLNTGANNYEAWKLSNHFRTTNDGFVSYPQNTYAAPLTATNNEL
jgi:hypothetical protein